MFKVAIVTPSMFTIPPQKYGGEMLLYDLCKGLSEIGFDDYTLIAPIGSSSPNGKLIETVPPGEGWQPEKDAYKVYAKYLDDFTVIHSNDHGGTWFTDSRSQSIPFIHTLHGISVWGGVSGRLLNAVTFSNFHRAFTKTHQGIDSRIVIHGVDLGKFKPQGQKEDYFLHIGLIAPAKAQDVSIDIAARLGIKLIVCGEDKFGPDKEYVSMIEKRCEEISAVDYLGVVEHQMKLELMQRAKAVLLPFRQPYVWSLISAEALACGTPVIASNVGGMPEVITDGYDGFLCNEFSDFDTAIKNIDTIKPENCRESAHRFDREKMAMSYLNLYRMAYGGERW